MNETPSPEYEIPFYVELLLTWPVLLGLAGAILLMLFVGIVVRQRFRRREPTVTPPPIDMGIDISRLPTDGPADGGLRVEVYGTPVRIAVIVLAPVGRDGAAP